MATATYFFDGNIGLTGASGWTDLTNSSKWKYCKLCGRFKLFNFNY